jgi:DME family drug/metabolite transporter
MGGPPVDDKASDTLVVVPDEGSWTGSSTLPHLHQSSSEAPDSSSVRGFDVSAARPRILVTIVPLWNNPLMPRLQLLLAAILFGTTGTAQALLADGRSPLAIGAGRIVVGGIVLAALAAVAGGWRPGGAERSWTWPIGWVLLAGAGVAVYQLAFFSALTMTGVAVGTVVAIGSGPIVAGLIEWRLEGRSPGGRWVIATALAMAGVVALTLASGADTTISAQGLGLAIVAGTGYAIYAVVARRLIAGGRPPVGVMGATFGTAAILLAPVLAVSGADRIVTDARPALLVLYLGLLPTAVAYILFARGLRHVQAAEATTIVLAEPVTATVLGILILGEHVQGLGLAGAALVLTGLLVLATPRARPRLRPVTAGLDP